MKTLLHLCIVITLVVSGCAVPAPVVKLTPSTLENKDYWNQGQQFVFSDNRNVWYDCGYNRIENGKLIFDIKVTNQTDTALLVDPATFRVIVFKNDTDEIARFYADDPEMILLNLKLDENVARAKAKNANTIGICSAILTAGTVVAIATSNKDVEKKENAIQATGLANAIVQTSADATIENANIREENNWTMRKSLAEAFLRKTTLPKNYYIDGEVHFPYIPEAKWYQLILTAGNSKTDFHFKQKLIYPQPATTAQR